MTCAVLLVACGAAPDIPQPADGREVVVSAVVDGDTVELDDGRTVRYLGINTPEYGQPYYLEALEANRELVEGQRAWLVLDTTPTDRYGRLLAYLWIGDRFVNWELVRRGFANTYTEPPDVRFSAEILRAEQQARLEGVGLWQPSSFPIRIADIQYNAPGRDDQNPNGEWVELVNDGRDAIELTRFTLKDEANHIYTFPRTSLKSGHSLRVYSGQGANIASALYWGLRSDAVWGNEGDTAYLRDPEGHIVDWYRYPTE